jgi:threonine/homoserine/homoserine lactone efflux protein
VWDQVLALLATWYLPAGVLIGLAAAAPIGPVNILVIQRTLQRGPLSALKLALGAGLGDAAFAVAAAFGLTAIQQAIGAHTPALRLVGGLIILGFAWAIWRSTPHLAGPVKAVPRTRHMALATFLLTVTNPATILWFLATFSTIGFKAVGFGHPDGIEHAVLLVAGVFAGSMLWWLFVSGFAARWRGRLADHHLVRINHVSAVVLALFGVGAVALALR